MRSAALAGVLFAAACAHAPAPPRAAAGAAAAKPARLDVPLFPDRTDQCGPSSLAGVLKFWGKDADPTALRTEIYRSSLKGALSVDILLAAQAHGMNTVLLDGLPAVKKHLDAGHPAIAFVNEGFSFYPIGHFMVLTGYDDSLQGVYANTDTRKNAFFPYSTFLKKWEKTDRWALVLLPPDP